MPVTIEIDTSARIILSRFIGEISETDFRSAVAALVGQPGFSPEFSHVIDFSQVTAAHVATEFMRDFARHESIFQPHAKQVIVAPQDYIFGLARMVQMLREQKFPNIAVVRSMEEARAVLGLDSGNILKDC